MKTTIAALGVIATLGVASVAEAAAVLDFNDLAQAGTGRKSIPQNNFKYQGFNFRSVYVGNPNFFTLGEDDPANADPDGTTFGHTWEGFETHVTKEDGSTFDVFSVDVADIFNSGAAHSGRFRFTFADNTQQSFNFVTDSAAGLETLVFDMKNVTGMLFLADVGENIQIDNIRLSGSIAAVPEPATWAMMILGFGAAGATLRRRRQAFASA